MPSKYDRYWVSHLPHIPAALPSAASGAPAVCTVPGLRGLGERGSWYGVAEVRGNEVTRTSMAHAVSLGKAVAADGCCAQWPECTFRFVISAAGDVLTISIAGSAARPSAPDRDARSQPAEQARQRGRPAPGRIGPGQADRGARQADTAEFYRILDVLARRQGGPRCLADCGGEDGWPRQGVYFFYEGGEIRADGTGRAVRVGTHALTITSRTTLWERLRQHRGRNPGGGNHRASVFRRHVGAALIRRSNAGDDLLASWLSRHHPSAELADREGRGQPPHRGNAAGVPQRPRPG